MKCLKRNQERVSDETDAPRSGVPTVIKISGTYCSETSDAAYRECNSLLLEHWVELVHLRWAEGLTKQMPAAFYIIFHLRHLHIQDYDRLAPVMSALLLICTAINYSCNKNGCSIKMWWHKCFAACFSGLLVHLAVVWPLTPSPPSALCPWLLGQSRHMLIWHLLPSFACFLTLVHAGLYSFY